LKSGTAKLPSERIVKDIRRATRKQYSAEEKIRIVLDGLRGEHSIAELCRREGIAERALNAEIDHHLDNGEEDGRPIAGMAPKIGSHGDWQDRARGSGTGSRPAAETPLWWSLILKPESLLSG
jgi:transposase